MKGTSEEGTERGMDVARKRGEGGSECKRNLRGMEGAWEQGSEGNFKGGRIFTNQPFTNRPLPLRRWYYKMTDSEHV